VGEGAKGARERSKPSRSIGLDLAVRRASGSAYSRLPKNSISEFSLGAIYPPPRRGRKRESCDCT